MSRASLLQETVSWMDTVDLALCLFIYEPARLLYGFIRITDHPSP